MVSEFAASHPYPHVALTVLAATRDEALVREVEAACRTRGYQLRQIDAAAGLSAAIASTHPDVVLLDLQDTLDAAVRLARKLASSQPDLPVVLVGESPLRSVAGFRVVDRWRAGERVLDQLELACIGIPASVGDTVSADRRASVQDE